MSGNRNIAQVLLQAMPIISSFIAALYLMGLGGILGRTVLSGQVVIVADSLMPFETMLLFVVATLLFYKTVKRLANLWEHLVSAVKGEEVRDCRIKMSRRNR